MTSKKITFSVSPDDHDWIKKYVRDGHATNVSDACHQAIWEYRARREQPPGQDSPNDEKTRIIDEIIASLKKMIKGYEEKFGQIS